LEFGGILSSKALGESDLTKFISQFFQSQGVEDIEFQEDFVGGNSIQFKQIAKNGVWKEKSVKPSMCSHLGKWHKLH